MQLVTLGHKVLKDRPSLRLRENRSRVGPISEIHLSPYISFSLWVCGFSWQNASFLSSLLELFDFRPLSS